jgi:heat shock protein HspQ
MDRQDPRFHIGQVVHHVTLRYRGVIVGVDRSFKGSGAWYDLVALSRPPKSRPWYHVLPDGTDQTTYVSEGDILGDPQPSPIRHPLVGFFFDRFENGEYVRVLN